jgi:uncharacterized protein YbbK (DUF523 family)
VRTPRVGISACLLGRAVRYDGRDKRAASILAHLGPHVEWVEVCPEFEAGLGVPREPMRLEQIAGARRLITIGTRRDLTETLTKWAAARLEELARADLHGYILKASSPSCGLTGVEIVGEPPSTPSTEGGRGLFAAALVARFPHLPVVQETDLPDQRACHAFLQRVRAYQREQSRDEGVAR